MKTTLLAILLALASLAVLTPLRAAAPKVPSNAELLKRINKLEAEIASLKKMQAGAEGTKPAASAKPSASKPAAGGDNGGAASKSVFDRSMSSAAAFTALDVSPETITKPTAPRDFVAGVLNGVDRDGKLQTGFAVEVTPFRWLHGHTDPSPGLDRILYDGVLSIATTKASEGGKEVHLAMGLNFTLLDQPEDKLRAALYQAKKDNPRTKPGWDEGYTKAWNEAAKTAFPGTRLAVAWAPVWVSPNGKTSSLKGDGGAAFATVSYAFGSGKPPEEKKPAVNSESYEEAIPTGGRNTGGTLKEKLKIKEVEALAHVRYRYGEHLSDSGNASLTAEQDSLMIAAGLRFGDENWHAQIESAFRQEWHGLHGDVGTVRVGGGFERRISKNLWFVLQVGNDFGSGNKKDELFTLGSFRFGTDDNPMYTDKKE